MLMAKPSHGSETLSAHFQIAHTGEYVMSTVLSDEDTSQRKEEEHIGADAPQVDWFTCEWWGCDAS